MIPDPGNRPAVSAPVNVDSRIAPIAGCKEVSTEELFVMAKWECPDGNRVYTFATPEQRTQWREIAEPLGTVVLDQGNLWVKAKGL